MSKKTRRKKLARLTGTVVPVRSGGPPLRKLRAQARAEPGVDPFVARALADRAALLEQHADELMDCAELAAVLAQALQGEVCTEVPEPYEFEYPDDGSEPIPAACVIVPHDEATTHRLLLEVASARDWQLNSWQFVAEEVEGEESMYPVVDPSVTSFTELSFHALQSAELAISPQAGGVRIRISSIA